MVPALVTAKLLLFAGLLLLVGGTFARRFLGTPQPSRRWLGLGLGLVTLGMALEVGWTLHDLGYLTPKDTLAYLTAYPPGRAALLTLMGGALLLAAQLSAWPHALTGASALLLLWGAAGSGHGGAHGPSTQAMTTLHAGAMSIWLGGLLALLWTKMALRPLAQRFSVVAATCLGLLTLSGAVLAADHGGSFFTLFDSVYGLVLLGKVAVVGLAVLTAGVVRDALYRNVSPRRALLLESAFLLGVLLVTAVLTTTAPPTHDGHAALPLWGLRV